ncbi:MAG: Rid family hydrolase, partial [Ferruginibacter sp.]
MWAKVKTHHIRIVITVPYPLFVQDTILPFSRAEDNFKFNIMTNQIIKTTKAPAPIGPYSQAVKAGNFLFISGQVAIDPSTAEMKNASLQEEAVQVM